MKILCEYCDKKVCRKNNEPYHLKCYKEGERTDYYRNMGIMFEDLSQVSERYLNKKYYCGYILPQ